MEDYNVEAGGIRGFHIGDARSLFDVGVKV